MQNETRDQERIRKESEYPQRNRRWTLWQLLGLIISAMLLMFFLSSGSPSPLTLLEVGSMKLELHGGVLVGLMMFVVLSSAAWLFAELNTRNTVTIGDVGSTEGNYIPK